MRDPGPASQGLDITAAPSISRLKRRADFLRTAKGRRWHGKAFSLQAAGRPQDAEFTDGNAPIARVGFTVTKKVGGSVVRNRARRRLREALRLTPDLPVRTGHDYVLIARIEAIRLPFSTLQTDLTRAIRGVHAEGRPHTMGSRRPKALLRGPDETPPPRGAEQALPPRGANEALPPRGLNRTKPRP